MPIIQSFTGLDLRTGDRPPGALDVATNTMLDTRGSLVRRPAAVRRCTLPVGTVGLYAVDDTLRAAAPNGTDTTGLFPTIFLDYLDAPDGLAGRAQAVRLASGRVAVWVESDLTDSLPAIHLTEAIPGTTATSSRITLPWSPWRLLGIGGRLMTLDREQNRIRWSGVDDPDVAGGRGYVTDWTEALDVDQEQTKGGFQPLYAGGSGPVDLVEYRGRACVLSRSSVQLWALDEGGIAALEQTVAGPGARHAGTSGSMSGDLLYIDGGGVVRLLSNDTQTASIGEEGAIGEPVASLSQDMAGPNDLPVAIYARSLGAFLLAEGNTILCLRAVAGQVQGWTRWTFPFTITHLCENAGTVYMRGGAAGRTVWSLSSNGAQDQNEAGTWVDIGVTAVPAPLSGRQRVLLTEVGAALLGAGTTLAAVVDGLTSTRAPTIPRSPGMTIRRMTRVGRSVSVEIANPAAPADWRCDSALVGAVLVEGA